ncbi:polymer-forming cytoskeletal protein [Candidatus Saccharibacteria bacterium]|nr:polymer-forming cytoskeletal protein [Candidatus Saccharibacteria bacterium]
MVTNQKKKRTVLLVLFAVILINLGFGLNASAVTVRENNDEYRVSETQTINDDIFVKSNRVVIEGVVNGDVYVAGSDISIRGVVNGDVFAAGSSIEVTGTIRDDLYAAGQTISLNKAEIGDSFIGFGANVKTTDDTAIGGSVIAGSSMLTLSGDIGRGVMAGSDNVLLNARVGQNSIISTSSLTIGEKAKINRDIDLYSEKKAKRETGSQVVGKINLKQHEEKDDAPYLAGFVAKLMAAVFLFTTSLIIGLAAIYVFRQSAERVINIKSKDYGQTFIWGIIIALIGIPISFLLMLSLIGFPLGIIALVLWLLAIFTAKIPGSYLLGRYLLQKRSANRSDAKLVVSPLIALALGLSIYYIVGLIPFVGGLVTTIISILGLGVFAMIYPHRRVKRTPTKATDKKVKADSK